MPRNSLVPTDVPVVSGLLAAGAPVPLEGISVEAAVTGEYARVTIAQRYRNRESQPIEAVYVFPLDETAAVCGFEAIAAGVHFVGEVKPRDEAFRIYDDALLAGHGAYLLDEERPDVFTASIGNLPPGAEVLIRLTYVTELAMEGSDALRFTLPTTVSPRYAPQEDQVGIGRPDAETLNPPLAWSVPYGLELTIAFQMPGAITRIESPSHPVSMRLDGTRATVTLGQAAAALDRDVVVVVEAEGLVAPHAIVERTPAGHHVAALAFRPTFDVEQAPSEVVFLVDRSGSMEGTSIAEVRNALQLCLRSLIPGSRFNIVGFGSTFTPLFDQSLPYDDASLARATQHVAALEANLGGTEILPALTAVLERGRSDLPRQLVLLTDGEVTNSDAVIALVGRHAAHTRVFTFGIGHGASAHLVRGIARAGNGAAEFISPGERAEAKVLRQFARVLAPALTDVRVDWGGLSVRTAPTAVPAVFAGGRVVIYGWLSDARPAVATLAARGPRGQVSHSLPIDLDRATSGTTLATLAARARIRELEEGAEWLEGRGSRKAARRAGQAGDEIIRLATTYGLASRETSFVAVERREVPVEGEMTLRRIPVALTRGWGGSHDEAAFRVPRPTSARSVPMATLDQGAPAMSFLRANAQFVGRRMMEALRAPSAGADAQRPLDRVVTLQRADGTWELTPELAAAVGMTLTRLAAGVAQVAGVGDARTVWATLVALAWLARHADDARDEWRLLARKSEQWLSAVAGDAVSLRAWQHAAETLVAG